MHRTRTRNQVIVRDLLRMLRKTDWLARDYFIQRLLVNHRPYGLAALEELAPDEALLGRNTGITVDDRLVIALPDKVDGRRQLSLEECGFKRRRL